MNAATRVPISAASPRASDGPIRTPFFDNDCDCDCDPDAEPDADTGRTLHPPKPRIVPRQPGRFLLLLFFSSSSFLRLCKSAISCAEGRRPDSEGYAQNSTPIATPMPIPTSRPPRLGQFSFSSSSLLRLRKSTVFRYCVFAKAMNPAQGREAPAAQYLP
jgi:hypothetical protein